MRSFDQDSTTDEVLEGIDLSGQRVVITGTSSGLGLESTRALASKGASVTMLARNVEKNLAAADTVRESVPGADLEVRELDLTSLASVRSCAEGLLAAHPHIDVLLNNAGVMCCPYSQTADGFENQLGTNHLGHFLLSILLAPALGGDRPSRLVELSSGAHGMADVDYDDPMFERREYDPWVSYGQSKTANALFALEFDRRLKSRGVSAYSVHPGMIMTELARHFTPELMAGMQKRVEEAAKEAGEEGPVDANAGMTFKSAEAGAATQCWAATAPELAEHGGVYLADCQVGVIGENVRDKGVEAYAQDPESAARLWTLSEELVGQKLDA
jgi:NAD(P)-dependent dehydrogenase (short-subunit alcohol dehydrogenase family)